MTRCRCACHWVARADLLSGEPTPVGVSPVNVGADVADPLAAAAACPVCLGAHCPALLTPRPAAPPRERAELPESLRGKDYAPPSAQADGESGG